MANIVYPPGCREISEDLGADELVRRLKTLSHTYQSMTQDDAAASQLIPLAKHLADDYLRDHPSKDVQLLVACCIADVLRVYAPDAPYTDPAQVKSIFLFIIKQLGGLKDPKDPAFKRYFYLLENLAYVKSFNMCLELEDSNEIICSLFTLMLKIVNDEHSSKVKGFMLDVLCPLVHESDVVSNQLLNTILINIVEPAKSTRKNAYALAKELVMKCSDTLEPYIQAFFNHVLILGKEEKALAISRKVYDLIYELNHICPTVLLAVVPQLEFKLKSTAENERYESVSLLARMFSERESNLALHHRQLWLAFLGRFNDISVKIRIKCVQYSMHFLLNHPELRADITDTLKLRQHDADEGVRYEVVMAIVATVKRDFGIVSDSEALLNFVKERTLDKKFKIRKEAMFGLAMIYRKYLNNANVPDATKRAVTWIKDKILHGYYMSSVDDRLLVERIVNTCLVPFTLPPEERMRKLFYLYTTLDENASKAFVEMQKQQLAIRRTVQELLELIRGEASDEREREMAARVNRLAKLLPDSVKAQEFIRKFCAHLARDSALLALMESVVSPVLSCRQSVDGVNTVLKKLGQPVMTNLYYNTVKQLLERLSSVLIDHDSLLALVGLVETVAVPNCSEAAEAAAQLDVEPGAAVDRGLRLLHVLASVQVQQFMHADVLTRLLNMAEAGVASVADQHTDAVTPRVLAVLYVVGRHRALSQVPQLAPLVQRLVPLCRRLATGGAAPAHAKQAVRCLVANCPVYDVEPVFADIAEVLKSSVGFGDESFRTAVVALSHIALHLADEFAVQIKNIISRKIVKETFMKDVRETGHTHHDDDEEDSWCELDCLAEPIRCKLACFKLMARWLVGLRDDVISAQKTFRMLVAFITHRGDLLQQGNVSKSEAAWLRLSAGCAMLKICEQKGVGDQFTAEQFYTLSQLMTDECVQVRERFAAKLHKGLNRGIPQKCLPLDFMGVYALAGGETDKRMRSLVRSYMLSDISKRRDVIKNFMLAAGAERALDQLPHIMPDYMLVFAVPVLAHDPEFQQYDDIDYLGKIRTCLWFILEPLITKNDNYSFGFYKALVEGMKNHHDAVRCEDDHANRKLWVICDLAMNLLLTKTSNFEMRHFPSEPRIPPMYFRKRADPGFVNSKIYLPLEMQNMTKRLGIACGGGGGGVKRPTNTTTMDETRPHSGSADEERVVEDETEEQGQEEVTSQQQRLIKEPPATYSRRSTQDRDRSSDSMDDSTVTGDDVTDGGHNVTANKQDKITSYFGSSNNESANDADSDVTTGSTNQRTTRRTAAAPPANERPTRSKAPPKLTASPFAAAAVRQRAAASPTVAANTNGSGGRTVAPPGATVKRKTGADQSEHGDNNSTGTRKSARHQAPAATTNTSQDSANTRSKRVVRGGK